MSDEGVGCHCGWPLDACNPEFAKGHKCGREEFESRFESVETAEVFTAAKLDRQDRVGASLQVNHADEVWGVFIGGELWAVTLKAPEELARVVAAAGNLSVRTSEFQRREANADRARRSGRWE